MALERVIRPKAKRVGSIGQKRLTCSNQTSETLAAAGARRRVRIAFHHPGRASRLVRIAVRDENAVLGLAEEEGEGIERPRRAHPGEVVRPQVDARLELLGESFAHA